MSFQSRKERAWNKGEEDAKKLGKLLDPNISKEDAVLTAYTIGYSAGLEEADDN